VQLLDHQPDRHQRRRSAGLVLGRLADIAEANVPGTLDDLDSEFLHDLRVSVRRARSVLRELRGVHPPAERAHLRDELRWVQGLSGPVRDLDVQLLEWDELMAALPEQRVADLAPLHACCSGGAATHSGHCGAACAAAASRRP
jgi:CHAD domain-containing protein